MPPPFADGLELWSADDSTPGSETYATTGNGVFVPADQDFSGCQWIVQCWQSPKWRSLSYHRDWWTIAYRWAEAEGGPFDGLPEAPTAQT